LIVLAFWGPLTEWTGYIFNAGLIFILFLNSRDLKFSKTLPIHLFITTALAGVLTIIYYSLALGFGPTIEAFLNRFIGRGISTGTIIGLIQGYKLSYGLFILSVIFSILDLSLWGNKKPITLFIFVAACVPLLENIVLLQHAAQFSFDRLKFIIPASLILAFSFAQFKTKGRAVLLILIILSCLQGYISYKTNNSAYSSWHSIDAENLHYKYQKP